MKKLLLASLVGAALMPVALSANTSVRVNGDTAVSVGSWSFSNNVLSISTTDSALRLVVPGTGGNTGDGNTGGGNTGGGNTGDGNTGGGTTPVPGECGSVASHVSLASAWDMASPASQVTISLTGNSTVLSTPINTTGNTAYNGQFQFAPTTGLGGISREVWISPCPGGLYSTALSACRGTGAEPTVYWSQGASTSWQCQLPTNTTYYLNIRNVNCGGNQNCSAYRMLYTNGRP